MADVMKPQKAITETQKVIKQRGGVPQGKTVVFIYDCRVGHPVILRYYKTPSHFQRAINDAHSQPAISDADVADMEARIGTNGRGYIIQYLVWKFKPSVVERFEKGSGKFEEQAGK